MGKRNVIIGGGAAGVYAIETIRELDPEASITLIGDEPANARMALPYWLAGSIPREQVLIGDGGYYDRLRVDARIGKRAASIDTGKSQVHLEDGTAVPYDNLLLATGSRPNRLAVPGTDLPGVTTLWTLADAARALEALGSGTEVCLVGAGFIGFIVLNALHKRGCRLTVVETARHLLPRMLDAAGATLVEKWLAGRGVTLCTGTSLQSIDEDAGKKALRLSNGRRLNADLVILATGVSPNVDLAAAAGLTVDHGIVVDHRCRTNVPNIYAAGDCAAGPNLLTGKAEVHAIQPTAVDHGRVAGANMAGRAVEYPGSLSMNILDVAGLQCASFGNWTGDGLEAQTIGSAGAGLLRKLVWDGSTITGAIFVGPMNDVCMLNDVGMVKGFIQTRTDLGEWKRYLLHENPADLRRPYVATGVPQKLIERTTLGLPSRGRGYRFPDAQPKTDPGPHHAVFTGAKA